MLYLLSSLALAALPPGVDLDEVGPWDDRALDLLAGPEGCWEMVGIASWTWDGGRFGEARGDAAFAGRLDNGEWTAFELWPKGEITRRRKQEERLRYQAANRFTLLVGRIAGGRVVDGIPVIDEDDEDDVARNAIEAVIDELAEDAYTTEVRWDDATGAVMLARRASLEKRGGKEALVEVKFPDGGTQSTALDLVFPEPFATERLVRIHEAEAHVRGVRSGDTVIPTGEAFRFVARFMGFSFVGAHRVDYRSAVRCATSTVGSAVD